MNLSITPRNATSITAGAFERRATLVWRVWFGLIMGLTCGMALFLYRSPAPAVPVAWLLFALCLVATAYQPRYGLYLIVFLSLLGDRFLTPAYPFTVNFSSQESLLFVHRALVFNPLEVCLILALLSWLLRGWMQRKLSVYISPLTWPALVFLGFVLFGLVWGLSRGGDPIVALWEARPLSYLPLIVLLATQVLERREHINHLLWAAMLAIFIEGLVGAYFVLVTLSGNLTGIERIAEHSMSIHQATLFVLLVAAWLYNASPAKRFVLPLMAPLVLVAFVGNQRRASYIALFLALGLMMFALHKERRQLFRVLLPPLVLVTALYMAAFWNSTGGMLGMPARAVRSAIAPVQNIRDELSNNYREIENVNITFTIRQAPLTGIGFGHKFYILVPLPDISFFVWHEYITHNSILWIWMKTGVGGFLSMVFLVGMAVMTGVRATWRMPGGDMAAAGLTATLYLVMHFIYAYVDMSWEIQNMVYVGAMMGVIGALEHVAGVPLRAQPRRWPWQPHPLPPPGLLSDTD